MHKRHRARRLGLIFRRRRSSPAGSAHLLRPGLSTVSRSRLAVFFYSAMWRADWKPCSGPSIPLPLARTLKSSPISAGLMRRCTAEVAFSDDHRGRILKKLGLNTNVDLVHYAMKHRLIE
jgi:hypothetical protein